MESDFKPWVRAVILFGVAYFVVAFGSTFPISNVRGWRLAAWVVSGVVYAAHLGYEHFHLNNPSLAIALHVAMAVALGAFLLAVSATVHATMVASHAPYWRFLLALLIWPIITAVPAFLVGLPAAAVLNRLPITRLAE